MKRIKVTDKSLLVGDEAADLLLAYAALIARIGRGDHVSLQAITVDGGEVTAGFLLNSGTVMVLETATGSALPEPDNYDAIRYMRERIRSYSPIGDAAAEPDAEPDTDGRPATDTDTGSV